MAQATPTTPLMAQYRKLKERHGDAFLFFRLGDFYEMFGNDAKEGARLLGLTLTGRNGVPMCGVPYHAAKTYIHRLIKLGRKVAICEQTGVPEKGKGLVDRDVVEVVTPGTLSEEDFLEGSANNYLCGICPVGDSLALAYLDLSTGELACSRTEMSSAREFLRRELERLQPAEIILPESFLEQGQAVLGDGAGAVLNRYPDWYFDAQEAYRILVDTLGTANLTPFGLDETSPEVVPLGVLLTYARENARAVLGHIRHVTVYGEEDYVGLDDATQRNLELVRSIQEGGRRYSLLSVMDETVSPMGGRLLRSWLLHPLRDRGEIQRRLDGVEGLYREQLLLSRLRGLLGELRDVERLAARISMERAHPKDLAAVRDSLRALPEIEQVAGAIPTLDFLDVHETAILERLADELTRALEDSPPILLTDGGIIRDGWDERLDEVRRVRDNGARYLEDYLEEEKQATGISSLKVRYNRIIGHYLEVTKANLHLVPPRFRRRQSLVNAERYTSDRLEELEDSINSADEALFDRERELFLALRETARAATNELLAAGRMLARLDVLAAFAYRATRSRYTRPEVNDSTDLEIVDGRHPVVEAYAPEGSFVPNSLVLDQSTRRFALITGPNMAGKSTFLRQTALIVLMAQVGSFVPAELARIGLVDRIFCRVGASDNLARGESTFLVEMSEAAHILRRAGASSLIIMDEVGRGTGTEDGLAIARAVTEHLVHRVRARTLFATHYHELTSLKEPGMFNLSLRIAEHDDQIVFLKRVVEGPASNSYGIDVAKLAGLPVEVVARAREVLRAARDRPPRQKTEAAEALPSGNPGAKATPVQGSLFESSDLILDELSRIDVDSMTPLEALSRIAEWKTRL